MQIVFSFVLVSGFIIGLLCLLVSVCGFMADFLTKIVLVDSAFANLQLPFCQVSPGEAFTVPLTT